MRRSDLAVVLAICLMPLVCDCATKSESGSMKADVVELMHVSGADSAMVFGMNYMIDMTINSIRSQYPDTPNSYFDAVKHEMKKLIAEKAHGLIERCVPVYEKHFSQDEVRKMIAFYDSPVGQKVRRETPLVQRECTAVGEEWGKGLQPEIAARLKARGL